MQLGKGSYGVVTKYKSRARKTFKQLKSLIQEYAALQYLAHCDYVVHCIDVNFHKLYLDMELYDMSLRTYLEKEKKNNEEEKHIIVRNILFGMVELQDLGLSHSDIKPGNILIQKNPFKAVLGDCGFVSLYEYAKQQRTAPAYRDLEIVNDDKHDIYSFAITYMEIMYNIQPNDYKNYKEIYYTIDHYVPKTQQHYMKKLVCHDRTKRPDARSILNTLYSLTPTINTIILPKYKYHHKIIYPLIKKHSEQLNIRRCKSGYYALSYYIHKFHVEEREYPYYIAAMLIILAAMFANKAERMDDIMRHCFPSTPSFYTEKVTNIIKKLTKNTTVIQILYKI